ncbi:EF hand domain-containing protein [Humitalea rosea]|uniref:EF hand domain-containing protein n=1 Tax=Humitalea rosea TaxID=990373 RepID=A0A2W7IH71_9PROT|nr:hypothetical protein [Humitalea rosea]PZW44996.1 EF hand domain-containing protein [Humitalea rosea]
MIRALVAAMLVSVPALAQGTPEALRGSWFGPDCAAPRSMLHITARAAATLPLEGAAALLRFIAIDEAGGWTIGSGEGATPPRLALRPAGEGLETVEPSRKTRDDRLPGGAPVTIWHRCPTPPGSFAILHGEGLAFMGTLERIEAGCGGPAEPCLAALLAAGDLTGDGLLSSAEVARLLRGAAWVVAAQGGADTQTLAMTNGAAGLGGLLAARLLVESLDYDGDGRISAAELRQDRAPLPSGAGDAAGRPIPTEGMTEGAGLLLRGVMEGVVSR